MVRIAVAVLVLERPHLDQGDRRRAKERDHHIIVAIASDVADFGGQSRVQEIREQGSFRQARKRADDGVVSVIVDNHVFVAKLRYVAVERRNVQSGIFQADRAGHVHLVVIVAVVPLLVAADFDLQRRARVHRVIADLVQDARAGTGSDGRPAPRNQIACDRAFAHQGLPVGQDHCAGDGAVVQAGHVEVCGELDVDQVRLGKGVVGRRIDECQRAFGHDGRARERIVCKEGQGVCTLFDQPAVANLIQVRVVLQRLDDVSAGIAAARVDVDQRAAVLDHHLQIRRPTGALGGINQVVVGAGRQLSQRAAVETQFERVRRTRDCAVDINAVRDQRTARLQIDNEAVVGREARRLDDLVKDLSGNDDSARQVHLGAEARILVTQAAGRDCPAADVKPRLTIAADDQIAGHVQRPVANVDPLLAVPADDEIAVHLGRATANGNQGEIFSRGAQCGHQVPTGVERAGADVELPRRGPCRKRRGFSCQERVRAQRPSGDAQRGILQKNAGWQVADAGKPSAGGAARRVDGPADDGQFTADDVQHEYVRRVGSRVGQCAAADFRQTPAQIHRRPERHVVPVRVDTGGHRGASRADPAGQVGRNSRPVAQSAAAIEADRAAEAQGAVMIDLDNAGRRIREQSCAAVGVVAAENECAQASLGQALGANSVVGDDAVVGQRRVRRDAERACACCAAELNPAGGRQCHGCRDRQRAAVDDQVAGGGSGRRRSQAAVIADGQRAPGNRRRPGKRALHVAERDRSGRGFDDPHRRGKFRLGESCTDGSALELEVAQDGEGRGWTAADVADRCCAAQGDAGDRVAGVSQGQRGRRPGPQDVQPRSVVQQVRSAQRKRAGFQLNRVRRRAQRPGDRQRVALAQEQVAVHGSLQRVDGQGQRIVAGSDRAPRVQDHRAGGDVHATGRTGDASGLECHRLAGRQLQVPGKSQIASAQRE